MKTTVHPIEGKSPVTRATVGVTAAVSFACLLGAGCASSQAQKESARSAPRVTVLTDSFEALRQEFNADLSRPRVLALLSPTCGGCLYGAKALKHEAERIRNLGERAKVLIVWVAMLESDNETEARASAQRFHFGGVRHFYDGGNRIGARLMAEQFPNAIHDALEVLPPDHELREMLEARKDAPPEQMPLWDAVLVFAPGVKWEARSPAPVWWTKQTSFDGEGRPGEPSAAFWKRSTKQPPVWSDWYLEAREAWRVTLDLSDRRQTTVSQ